MDIDARLEQIAELLADNLTALDAVRAALEATTAVIAGNPDAARLARELADLDPHAQALAQIAEGVAALGSGTGCTAEEIRAIRRKEQAAARRAQARTRPDHLRAVAG